MAVQLLHLSTDYLNIKIIKGVGYHRNELLKIGILDLGLGLIFAPDEKKPRKSSIEKMYFFKTVYVSLSIRSKHTNTRKNIHSSKPENIHKALRGRQGMLSSQAKMNLSINNY